MDTMAYKGAEPYAFISYSHADRVRVEALLRILKQFGRRFWYDAGIDYGENWEEVIDRALRDSSMFLLLVTNGIEQRPEIIREMRMALKKREQGEYHIFVVLLERVPLLHLFRNYDDLTDMLKTAQYIAAHTFGGITMSFVETLAGRDIWQYASTPEELAAPRDRGSSFASLEDVSADSGYIYPLACPIPRTGGGLRFYMLQVGETDPNTVYPICMDNQWCPPEFLEDLVFQREGFRNEALQERRTAMQQNEVLRALLHNWQVLINRASIFNTRALAQWYAGPEEERGAFLELLRNGSFVVYLMGERTPVERPRFDVDEEQFQIWREICKSNAVYCIRMSWEDAEGGDEANHFEISRRLSMQMQELLLTTANDPYRLEAFRHAMRIPEAQAQAFRELWQRVRQEMILQDDARPGSYTRNNVYLDFLTKDGTKVPDCILDYGKPFVRELKQIVDFRYSINLPSALHIRPMSSYADALWDYEMSERRGQMQMRTISADELYCAVALFRPTFLESVCRCRTDRLTLSAAAKIRRLPEWTAYLEALSAGRKRANLNEVDFHDVEVIWMRYRALLAACQKRLPELQMASEPGCISFIYRFGMSRLVAVYRQESETIRILTDDESGRSNKQRENLTVDFVFGDVTQPGRASDCFLEKLRLFEGIIQESVRTAYAKVLLALREHPSTTERMDGYVSF